LFQRDDTEHPQKEQPILPKINPIKSEKSKGIDLETTTIGASGSSNTGINILKNLISIP
jgi:hypothetical protein